MHFLAAVYSFVYAFTIAIASDAPATPLYSETIVAAGRGPSAARTPATLPADVIKNLQFAAFLENMESSFFNESLRNLTEQGTNGYPNDTIQVVGRIAAQEQVHLAALSNLFEVYNVAPTSPCNYTFPIASIDQFFDVAHIVTSVGLGATIGLIERLAVVDPRLARSVSSILSVEARHDAFFRSGLGKVPNPAPFDTGISDVWAYNLVLFYVIPGSCPVEIPLPILPTLTIVSSTTELGVNTTGNSTQLEFAWDPTQATFVAEAGQQLLVGWVNQLNTPIYSPLNITGAGKGTARVPKWMSGVGFASLTVQQPDNVQDLGLATLAGPVVISFS